MATRRVVTSWNDSYELLTVMVHPYPADFVAVPSELDPRLIIFCLPREDDAPAGELVGAEIDDFLNFARWDAFAGPGDRWYLDDHEPRPVAEFLQGLQSELRVKGKRAAIA